MAKEEVELTEDEKHLKEGWVWMTLPIDAENPDNKVETYQQDFTKFRVVRGKKMLVPPWVKEIAVKIGDLHE